MDKEKVFADGLMWKDPNDKAPKWIKGSLMLSVKKFQDFLKTNEQYVSPKGWLTIDMKESQKGGIYFELNTWKPETSKPEGTEPRPIAKPTSTSGADLLAMKRYDDETGEELAF